MCRTTHRKCVTSFLSTAAERKFLSGQNICFILTIETVSGWAHCQVHSHLNRSESTDRAVMAVQQTGISGGLRQWLSLRLNEASVRGPPKLLSCFRLRTCVGSSGLRVVGVLRFVFALGQKSVNKQYLLLPSVNKLNSGVEPSRDLQ